MGSGLRLRQINQVLRDAFLFQNRQHHRAVAGGARVGTLENAASAIRKVRNETRDLVGHHERQIGSRVLDVSFGLSFRASVGGRSETVGLVDGSWLSFLLLFLFL